MMNVKIEVMQVASPSFSICWPSSDSSTLFIISFLIVVKSSVLEEPDPMAHFALQFQRDLSQALDQGSSF